MKTLTGVNNIPPPSSTKFSCLLELITLCTGEPQLPDLILLTSSPTFALSDSGGGFPLVGDD
ncbi:hypothetical protein D3029_23410 [Escherichia coli]|nr:hypothetical protein [Escherichia coli]EFN9261413.1 hypothetical protein [Escherichia coli]